MVKLHPALFPLHLAEEAAILFSCPSPSSEILRSTLMAIFSAFFLFFRSLFFSRISLATEILVLRQQLLVLNRTVKRPNLRCNFGAATGPRNSSTQIDQRRIASKGLLCLITNRPSAEYDTNRNYEEEIGFGTIKKSCLHS